jgi:hypothetical protein
MNSALLSSLQWTKKASLELLRWFLLFLWESLKLPLWLIVSTNSLVHLKLILVQLEMSLLSLVRCYFRELLMWMLSGSGSQNQQQWCEAWTSMSESLLKQSLEVATTIPLVVLFQSSLGKLSHLTWSAQKSLEEQRWWEELLWEWL